MVVVVGLCSLPRVVCLLQKKIFFGYSAHILKSHKVEEVTGEWSTTYQKFESKFMTKQPLLVRGAFPEIDACGIKSQDCKHISQNKLLTSRLIKDATNVQYGPFGSADYHAMADSRWSLLINDMERFVPEIYAIREAFHFLPNWCHDDIMLSCGSKGSTIGAHVDSYDVCLIQVSGTKHWEVDGTPMSQEVELKNLINDGRSLRVLKESAFKPSHAWRMSKGDMLYLPPRLPHRFVVHCFSFNSITNISKHAPMYHHTILVNLSYLYIVFFF
jgi:50S ribosomal protein L16 3-hydroxylase